MDRQKILDLIAKMRHRTIDRGCTPAEAEAFAAKIARYIEEYQIQEAELLRDGTGDHSTDDVEVCQNTLRTGQRVFNPGRSQVVNHLAIAMCCKCVLLHQNGEAVYGVVGEQLDADYVCQMSATLVPLLQSMARLEGVEHGYEKAGLIRWANQYLTGAAKEIRSRIERDRQERSTVKENVRIMSDNSPAGCTALAVVTGETLAVAKRDATAKAFKELHPRMRRTRSRSEYDGTADQQGRIAGRSVGLNIAIE